MKFPCYDCYSICSNQLNCAEWNDWAKEQSEDEESEDEEA